LKIWNAISKQEEPSVEDVDEKQDEAMPEPAVEIHDDVQMNANAGDGASGDVRSDPVSQSLTKNHCSIFCFASKIECDSNDEC
jgi:hypothetical protein